MVKKYLLEACDLSKSFGPNVALQNVSLNFEAGRIYGLFGRNGAGKTTLLNILSTRIFADDGTVFCEGENVTTHPKVISQNCCYMPEQHYFPGRFKVKTLLSHGQFSFPNFNGDYARDLCQIFNLNINQKYDQLSRGHQSIFRIVMGLAARAPITIFDEPVLGLDAVARDMFYRELIEEFSRDPRLFIISTHLIEESADLFNEAIIIKNGAIIRQASVDDLLSNMFYVSGKSPQIDEYLKDKSVITRQDLHGTVTAVVEGETDKINPIQGLRFDHLTIQKLFIHLTNEDAGQEQN